MKINDSKRNRTLFCDNYAIFLYLKCTLKVKDTFIAEMEIADSLNNRQKYKVELHQSPYPAIRVYQLK
ncbi:hypothetical protein EG347_08665 [Chryseobacterium sp. G0186]|nr:hypothetical protein EG347_08665 [Chryseobacterium sp. G0186]